MVALYPEDAAPKEVRYAAKVIHSLGRTTKEISRTDSSDRNDWFNVIFTMLYFALSVVIYRWGMSFEPVPAKVVIFGDAMALGIVFGSFRIYVAVCKRVCGFGGWKHVKQL